MAISLKLVGGITSHLGHKVIVGSSIVFQILTLGWPRVTLNFFGGGGLQQEDHLASNFRGKGRLLSEPALRFCIRAYTWG